MFNPSENKLLSKVTSNFSYFFVANFKTFSFRLTFSAIKQKSWVTFHSNLPQARLFKYLSWENIDTSYCNCWLNAGVNVSFSLQFSLFEAQSVSLLTSKCERWWVYFFVCSVTFSHLLIWLMKKKEMLKKLH